MKMKKRFVILFIPLFTSCLIFSQTNSNTLKSSSDTKFKFKLINVSELNAGIGLGGTDRDYSKQFFGLTNSIGFGVTRNLICGIGTGVSFYNGGTIVPLYFNLKYFLIFNKISIYGSGDGGLLFNLTNSSRGIKYFINPFVGLLFPVHDNLNANLSGGIFLQTSDEDTRDSFVNLKLGITYIFKNRKNR